MANKLIKQSLIVKMNSRFVQITSRVITDSGVPFHWFPEIRLNSLDSPERVKNSGDLGEFYHVLPFFRPISAK